MTMTDPIQIKDAESLIIEGMTNATVAKTVTEAAKPHLTTYLALPANSGATIEADKKKAISDAIGKAVQDIPTAHSTHWGNLNEAQKAELNAAVAVGVFIKHSSLSEADQKTALTAIETNLLKDVNAQAAAERDALTTILAQSVEKSTLVPAPPPPAVAADIHIKDIKAPLLAALGAITPAPANLAAVIATVTPNIDSYLSLLTGTDAMIESSKMDAIAKAIVASAGKVTAGSPGEIAQFAAAVAVGELIKQSKTINGGDAGRTAAYEAIAKELESKVAAEQKDAYRKAFYAQMGVQKAPERTFTVAEARDEIAKLFDKNKAENKNAQLPDEAKTQFLEGYNQLVAKIPLATQAKIKVSEKDVALIFGNIYTDLIKARSDYPEDMNHLRGAATGVFGVIKAGLSEEADRTAATTAVSEKLQSFGKDDPAKAKIKAAAEKNANNAGKLYEKSGMAMKATSVGLVALLTAFAVKLWRGSEVEDEKTGEKKRSSSIWAKALGVLMTASSVMFAWKVAKEGKSAGVALGEMNPVSWVSKWRAEKTATAAAVPQRS